MKPIKFEGHNVVFAENQEEYQPLPALQLNDENGQVTSCWKMTFTERLRVLVTGKIWVSQLMFRQPTLTPVLLSTKQSDHFRKEKDDEQKS